MSDMTEVVSFIKRLYIAPLQGYNSDLLLTPAHPKGTVLRLE